MTTLVYVGVHKGEGLRKITKRYDRRILIEANAAIAEQLRQTVSHTNAEVYSFAAGSYDGVSVLNISDNDGQSSSIGTFKTAWPVSKRVSMVSKQVVNTKHLGTFLASIGVYEIDDYISDIQGMDLCALRTLAHYIAARKIGTIQCEVTKDRYANIYDGLPENRRSNFDGLLSGEYEMCATGSGILEQDEYAEVPEGDWEYDCKWRLR
jgi:FkbM family methyltransferase